MIDSFLSRIFTSQWSILLTVTTVLVICASAGVRLGLAARKKDPEAVQGYGGSLQGAVLGLLGLLLGFSFAMAVGRYDSRRSLVLEEANAIGTTWLRADFLEPELRGQSRQCLKRYTELRLEGFRQSDNPASFAKVRREVGELHTRLWALANEAVRARPGPVVMGYVDSLNGLIDLDASRMSASRNHVPGAVWLMLVLVGGCGAWANGYSTGAAGVRSIFTMWVFPILIGVVITLIADIDSSHRGLIGMSQTPLEELLKTMQP